MENKHILDSWKEIAAYLKRSVTTCQRFERELDLPIHRLEDSPKARVFAYKEELDSWMEKILQAGASLSEEEMSLGRKRRTITIALKKLLIPAIGAAVLIFTAVIVWQLLHRKEPVSVPSEKPSIAVLPFEDLSPQKDQGHLCDGFAESIINSLTKIRDIRIPARTSSFSFKGKKQDLHEIGERLKVNTVLEGSVQKEKNKLRITVKHINVSDESLLWSEQYNRDLNDVFAIQDDVTFAIVDKLKVNLLGGERGILAKRYTENREAYNLYLKGCYFWNRRTEEDLKKALDCFEKAIELDPNYAMAYVGLANTYGVLPNYTNILPEEAYPKVEKAAKKALDIDSSLAEAHVALAGVRAELEWDWESGEKELRKAIELNPHYASAHQLYSELLSHQGRHEDAIKEINRALELDPLSLIINRAAGVIYFYARKYDKAIEALERTIELDPTFSRVHRNLGEVYLQKSMYEYALAEFQKEKDVHKAWSPMIESLIGITYMKMGKRDEAQKVMEDLLDRANEEYVSPYVLGRFFIVLGKNDLGFKYLVKAYEEHNYRLVWLNIDPFFDNVRSNSRYKAVVKKVGLGR